MFLSPNTTSLLSRYKYLRFGIPNGFADSKWNYGGHMSPIFYTQINHFMKDIGFSVVQFSTNRYYLYNMSKLNEKK